MPSLRSSLQCILTLTLCCAAALPSSEARKWDGASTCTAKALYVMTNDVDANAIVAMSIGRGGKLSGGSITPTGGSGSNLLNPDGTIAFPDALSVQDSVVLTSRYLFAVNAGSNTLSMFDVSPSNPTNVTLLGESHYTEGTFPVSVAVSSELNLACVANQGLPSGVSCAKFSEQGLAPFDALRPVNFGATQNPPSGPVPGVGDIFFTEDQSALLVTVKGNTLLNLTFSGFVAKFAVENGEVASAATITTPPGTEALFGTSLVPGSPHLIFASDAGFGAVTLNIDDLAAEPVATVKVAGQMATCWAQISDLTGTGFVTDVGVNRLVEVDIRTGAIVSEYYPPNPFVGMSDFRIRGGYLWSLSAGNGSVPASVTTFYIGGGVGTAKQVSTFAIPGAGVNTMGLVVF